MLNSTNCRQIKSPSTCPVCCINTYPTSPLPSPLNYDIIIISLVLTFTCCTNSCYKDKNNLIKSLDVSRGKRPSIFSAPFALIQVWRERALLRMSCNTHWVYDNADVLLQQKCHTFQGHFLLSANTEGLRRQNGCSNSSFFWRRRNTSDSTKFCSLYVIFFLSKTEFSKHVTSTLPLVPWRTDIFLENVRDDT